MLQGANFNFTVSKDKMFRFTTGFRNAISTSLLEKLKCISSKYGEVLCTYLYGRSVYFPKAFFLSITAISESHTMAGSFLSEYQHKTHSNKRYGLLGGYKAN
jgi:hypothetical protein